MAWKLIPYTPATDEIADVEGINANFLAVVEEVTGGLNEHNWAAGAFSDRTVLEDGIALRVKQLVQGSTYDPTDPTSGTDVDFGEEWHAISGMSVLFTTDGGMLWIIASFQFDSDAAYGVNFAIELDGEVLGESLLGSGDLGNDYISPGGALNAATGIPPSGSYRAHEAAPALWGGGRTEEGGFGVVVSALTEVPEGRYSLKVVVRNVRRTSGATPYDTMHVGNRELILLEMT